MSKTTRLAYTMENLSLLKVEMAKKDIKYLNPFFFLYIYQYSQNIFQ